MNETEEEQIEAMKKWWAENGRSIIIGVVLGIGGIFGWRYYEAGELDYSRQASQAFQEVLERYNQGEHENLDADLNALKSDFSKSPYAALGELLRARKLVDDNELEQASASLRWAVDNSPEEDVRTIGRIRLARVYTALDRADDALAVLDEVKADSFAGLLEEVRGDAWLAKGDPEKARQAYQRASVAGEGTGSGSLLQMKIDDLAVADANG